MYTVRSRMNINLSNSPSVHSNPHVCSVQTAVFSDENFQCYIAISNRYCMRNVSYSVIFSKW